ncbi:MAG: sodium-anion symporter, partial [Caldilineaceae bacterium]|nr:sodium-anion symporter [Caldilineaceae bacterium]
MTFKRTRLKSALPQTVTLPLEERDSSKEQNGKVAAGSGTSESAAHEASLPNLSTTRSALEERTRVSKRRLQRRSTPLLVLQQPLQAGVRKVFDLRRLIIVLALSGAVLLLPQPEGLSFEGHRALALFVFTGSI